MYIYWDTKEQAGKCSLCDNKAYSSVLVVDSPQKGAKFNLCGYCCQVVAERIAAKHH